MFMREGTPSGFSTMSTGVPSAMYGMSSSGRMREITPLLPWRPAILSPTDSLRLMATYTLTILNTPGGSSSPFLRRAIFSSKTVLITLACSSMLAKMRSTCSCIARVGDLHVASSGAAGSASSFSPVIDVARVEPDFLAALVGDAVRRRLADQQLAHASAARSRG